MKSILSIIALGVIGLVIQPSMIRAMDPYEVKRLEAEAKNEMREEVKREEDLDKRRKEQVAAIYYELAEKNLKIYSFEPTSSLKECMDKIGMQAIEAESVSDAGALAKKQASKDSDYIIKQIEACGDLASYKISTTSPYFISDKNYGRVKTKTLNYSLIKYKKKFVTQYPQYGITPKRVYKYISSSKGTTNTQLKFEEGEVIFVQKGLDLNTKMNELRCTTITGTVSSDVIKKVITQHNNKIKK